MLKSFAVGRRPVRRMRSLRAIGPSGGGTAGRQAQGEPGTGTGWCGQARQRQHGRPVAGCCHQRDGPCGASSGDRSGPQLKDPASTTHDQWGDRQFGPFDAGEDSSMRTQLPNGRGREHDLVIVRRREMLRLPCPAEDDTFGTEAAGGTARPPRIDKPGARAKPSISSKLPQATSVPTSTSVSPATTRSSVTGSPSQSAPASSAAIAAMRSGTRSADNVPPSRRVTETRSAMTHLLSRGAANFARFGPVQQFALHLCR